MNLLYLGTQIFTILKKNNLKMRFWNNFDVFRCDFYVFDTIFAKIVQRNAWADGAGHGPMAESVGRGGICWNLEIHITVNRVSAVKFAGELTHLESLLFITNKIPAFSIIHVDGVRDLITTKHFRLFKKDEHLNALSGTTFEFRIINE